MIIKNYEIFEQEVFSGDGIRTYKKRKPYVVLISNYYETIAGTVEKFTEKGDTNVEIEIRSSAKGIVEIVNAEFRDIAFKNGFCGILKQIK